jgi:hypothetical protein
MTRIEDMRVLLFLSQDARKTGQEEDGSRVHDGDSDKMDHRLPEEPEHARKSTVFDGRQHRG